MVRAMRIAIVVLVLAVGAALALWVGERLHVQRRKARERADR